MLLLLLATVSVAFPIHGTYTLERILNAYDEGEIDFDQYVAYTFYAGLKRDLLPPEFEGVALAPLPMSGTYFMIKVISNKDRLSPEIYDHLIWLFPSFCTTALTGNYMGYGEETVYSYETENFKTWYVTTGIHAADPTDSDDDGIPDVVEFTADYYEYDFDSAQSRGWWIDAPQGFHPLGDWYSASDYPELGGDWGPDWEENPKVDIHIGNMAEWTGGPGVIAFTVFQLGYNFPLTDRADCPAYLAMSKELNYLGSPTDEVSAHEFHHVMQCGYDFYNELGTWLEMCAMWNEYATYPEGSDYMGWLSVFFGQPHLYLFTDDSGDGYAHCIWAFFLDAFLQRELINPLDIEGPLAVWRAQCTGDEWITGGSVPGSSDVDRRTWEAMGYHYYVDSESPISTIENYEKDTEYFQEAFVQFTRWNWYTGDRDPNDEYYFEGHTYPQVILAGQEDPVPEEGVDWTGVNPVYWPDNFGTDYIWAANFPVSWDRAVMKFLADRELNPSGSEQWDGWLIKKIGGDWIAERLFCPWDNGIAQFDLNGVDEATLVVCNKSWEPGKTFSELEFQYSIIEVAETTPPVVNFASVIPDSQPEYILFAIAADEATHGVPEILVEFTPDGGETDTDSVLADFPDPAQPVFYATYSVSSGVTGSGTIILSISDLFGNITTVERDFAAGVVVAGMTASLGNDEVELYLPVGCTTKTSTILVIEEELTTEVGEESEAMALMSEAQKGGFGLTVMDAHSGMEMELLGRAYRIEPGWMDLNGTAELSMSYADLDVVDESKVSVYRADGEGGWVEIGGEVNPKYDRITAQISSFGVYALGYGEGSSMGDGGGDAAVSYSLSQNYPNPFSEGTTIRYSLEEAGPVSIKIYNLSGQLVDVLVDEVQQASTYTVVWDGLDSEGEDAASGLYIYRMSAGNFQSAKKMVLVR